MTSFEVHRSFSATARLLLLAAIATPCTGFAQRDPTDDLLGVIAERITEAQARGGPYSTELIDPLKSLSVLYEENGNHALASAVLEQAMQVIRANYGLRSLEQAPLLQQRIRSEEARGNFGAAWDLEQDLLTLARRQPNDLGAAPILHEIGDKRMDLLEGLSRRGDSAADHPRLLLPGAAGAAEPAGAGRFRQLHLGAKGHRSGNDPHGCANALRAGDRSVPASREAYSSDELRELETKLIHSSYAYGGSYQVGSAKPVAARFVWRRQRGAAVAANRFAHPDRRLGPVVRPTAAGDRALRGHLRVPRATRRSSSIDRRVVLARDAAHAAHVRGKPRGRGSRADRDRTRRHRLRDHVLRNEPATSMS